ncbi:metallophosphoesterase [Halobacterium wangiae]|uniref:metallophosphoesterase n=1 Tax=Halobacterium wangiae TaxID=2902623 RepID=UPI001E334B88|nr:metallophosphoesterase [Halobacterium wangiae]
MSDTPPWATFGERAVHLPGPDALVLADLHVGRDAASDVSLPLSEGVDLRERLAALLATFSPETVVFAGDLLHVHGTVPGGVHDTVEDLLAAVASADADLRVVKGNHDTMLDAVGVDSESFVELDDGTVVCHGHELPSVDATRYVAGHQHPAVKIEGHRRPCFLYGPEQYEGRDVLVLPAFTRLAPGTLVNGLTDGAADSPLLDEPDGFRPVVVSEGEALGFPALADLRGLL